MLKLIKSLIGGAPAAEANATFKAERRSLERQGRALDQERRVAWRPHIIAEPEAQPVVAEGNSDADWDLWQNSIMAQDGAAAQVEAPVKPPPP